MKRNLALLCDFYEFTMSYGYLKSDLAGQICYFDVYFRQMPDNGGYVIAAGLHQIISFIENLHFDDDDIEFFRSKNLFDDEFLDFLREFKFSGDLYAVREGEIVFANEPLVVVRAPAPQAQLLETFILLSLNHQSLIATKASRIVYAAKGRAVLEFGSRRAQGIDAALLGARAAFIGGASGSACALADKLWGIKAAGTMAHSWVQLFESELDAFVRYCELYPHSATLLIDTYSVQSGIKNAIKAFKSVLIPRGISNFAVRLDSGELCSLSKFVRNELDKAGLKSCKIVASGALDEFEIQKLIKNGAKIDIFGVGERLITAKSSPVLGCVYKLVAIERNGRVLPRIKISESSEKISNPHHKRLFRIFDDDGKALYDELCLADESENFSENSFSENLSKNSQKSVNFLSENDENKPKSSKNSVNFLHKNSQNISNSAQISPKNSQKIHKKELLVSIFKDGKLVYKMPKIDEVKAYASANLSCFDEDIRKLKNPKKYELKLSQKLKSLKNSLLKTSKAKA